METRELLSNAMEILIPLQSAEGGVSLSGVSPHVCLASLDAQLSVVTATDDFFTQFGKPSSDVCGSSLYALLPPEAQPVLEPYFAQLADGDRDRFNERVLVTKGGDGAFAGDLIAMAVRGEGNQLSSIVVLFRPDALGPRPDERAVATLKRSCRSGRRKSLLTPLDARILEGVAAGASTMQLATRLYLSRQGVEYHVGSMLRKLRVSNRAALVSRAYSMGLLVPGAWPPRIAPEIVNVAA